jgi:hypothetical protein
MPTHHSRLSLIVGLALAGLPSPAGAQPVGSEFQINTYTTSDQRTWGYGGHLIAADGSGNFIVVWHSFGQDGHFEGVFSQRYDSSGMALGSEFPVNSYTTFPQRYPSVAAATDGNFVVVWEGRGDDDTYGIFGQRYDSAGGTLGSEFRVNSVTASYQHFPAVSCGPSGNFVVVWQSYAQDGSAAGIFGQRYDEGGVPLGNEFRINSFTRAGQYVPSISSDSSGNFVVVWESLNQDESHFGIFGQRYDSEGVPRGSEFRANSFTSDRQDRPSLSSDASGNFVVVWESYAQDGSGWGIFGQRFDQDGVALGSEFRANSYTSLDQAHPSVSSDASGNFVVVWDSIQDGSGLGIFGQRYSSDGVAEGEEFQVNSFTTGNQRTPSVRATGTNRFVVAWESETQDGSSYGVFGQRYDFSVDTITVLSPNTNVKWRIGSLQKIQWSHMLGADATFRIELDRDDDGNYEELIADAAPVDSTTKGSFAWTVSGPLSGTARARVSWTDDLSVSDASDVTFQIRPLRLD